MTCVFLRFRFATAIKSSYLNKFASNFSTVKTIFALSSGQGKCGVAVIRVSGPQAGKTLQLMAAMETLPKPRHAVLKKIRNPQTGEILDKGILLWFPGPRSFTGEDCCELQVHGGFAVITAILNALASIPDCRIAEPGEFTRRAFFNAKLDLTEVEGLADLLAAETEVQRKQAFLQTQGSLSKIYNEWKNVLIECLANLEAYIDFEETETLETGIFIRVTAAVKKLSDDIRQHLNDGHKGERLRSGVKTVIIGEPNVGKSSLLNILCRRPAAIVTPLEGTTRDVLEVALDIGGYPLVLADTAGLRSQTVDIVEKEGIRRALNACQSADLIFLVIDCVKYLQWYKLNPGLEFLDFVKLYVLHLNINDLLSSSVGEIFNKECIIVANKIDLIQDTDMHIFKNTNMNLISCKCESGFSSLLEEIASKLKILCGEPSGEHPSMNQLRHRQHLTQCLKYLERFLDKSDSCIENNAVLAVEEVRQALRQIGKITGTVTTEELLDFIFKQFCIGK